MRFASPNNPLRSALGLRWPPNTDPQMTNAAFGAIDITHSILIELWIKWHSPYRPGANHGPFSMDGSVAGNIMGFYYRENLSDWWLRYESPTGDITHSLPFRNETGIHYFAVLVDKTNDLAISYHQGQPFLSSALLPCNPDFSTFPNKLFLGTRWAGFVISCDASIILLRITSLVSVPATINADIFRMYQLPMNGLAPNIQANLGAIASQYDFSDPGTDNPGAGAHTVVGDHGAVGGYPLSSGATDLRKLYKIVEKP